ncbi:MAG: glycoside hydrolase family 2 TIM barrel-domain containing protein [Opitutaceae bacterium]|nr:glycoside hydrolase family 2 TIM barrel-domain containing protein [Opitutaceae bacterium]
MASPSSPAVEIRESAEGFILLHHGEKIYLNGAAIDDATALPNVRQLDHAIRFDHLKRAGGNAARLKADKQVLDEAHKRGIAGVVDLILEGERDGMDWNNDAQVQAQAERALALVRELKDHPALLMWIIGNELDYIPPDEPYNPRIWERLDELAVAIKAIDPKHPVLTIVGSSQFETKIKEITEKAPHLDLLGLNGYGELGKIAGLTHAHFPKPYIITEWGPTGHWEVARTTWGAPIEETSSEKAAAIHARYRDVVLADKQRCLGSFLFYWADKQETTHTWYGLYCEDQMTEGMDTMAHFWTGQSPANQAPRVKALTVDGSTDKTNLVLKPGQACEAALAASDPDGDTLTYTWDIRPEVVIPDGNYAGRKEKRSPILEGLTKGNGAKASFTVPEKEGAYRLFVTVRDGKGSIGYANFPFYVSATGELPEATKRYL